MEQKNNKYYSYISEYYAANPTKFEKRKNNLKPVLYSLIPQHYYKYNFLST